MSTEADNKMIRAARVRAAIIGAINSSGTGSLTTQEISQVPEVLEYQLSIQQVRDCTSQLKTSKLIHSIPDVARGSNYVLYRAGPPPEDVEPKRAYARKEVPTLKVDLIKATGRVRLEINGIVIEIGVV